MARKTTKKQGFFFTEPLKSLEKKGKTLKKNKEFLAGPKNKEFQKNKERKDREVRASEGRDSEARDYEARDSENEQTHGPPFFQTPLY